MNILLLGSGGRESALAWKINQSPLCDKLFIAQPFSLATTKFIEHMKAELGRKENMML